MQLASQRNIVLPLVAGLALGWGMAIHFGASNIATAQERGDEVIVTFKNGRAYRGVLEESGDREVRVKVGDTSIQISRSMIQSIEIAPPRGGGAPSDAPRSTPPPPRSAPGGGNLSPATISFIDGTTTTGFVVSRDSSRLWVVQGVARSYELTSIANISGGPPLPGAPSAMGGGGTPLDRARVLVTQLDSGDEATVAAAAAALESLGPDGATALSEGLARGGSLSHRLLCVHLLGTLRVDETQPVLVATMANDEDPKVRATVAGVLGGWYSEAVRIALMDRALRDDAIEVRAQALRGLARQAGPADVAQLMTLVGWVQEGSPAREPLFEALRRASGKPLASVPEVWRNWWDADGPEEMRLRESQPESRSPQTPQGGD